MNWNTEADRALRAHLYTYRPAPPPAFERAVREACAAIREGRTAALPQRGRARPRPVRRALLAAALLLLLFGAIVACVPAARAEVLSWFGIVEPEEYLAAGPDAREPNAALDAMIASPDPAGPAVAVTDTGEVAPISELLAARLVDDGVAFGETLYDGSTLYVALTLQNGFGIWLLEQYCGGSVTRVEIPPERLEGFFQPEVPEEYRSGEQVYYSVVEGWLYLTFPDGTTAGGMLQALNWADFPRSGEGPDQDAVNAAFLETSDVAAYLETPMRFDPSRYADANGLVTARAELELTVELTSPVTDPPVRVLLADLGTVTVNATGYRDAALASAPQDGHRWSGTALVTEVEPAADGSNVYTYTQREFDLDGLSMYDARALLSPTGNLGAEVAIEFPAHWTEAQVSQFARALDFRVYINGEGPRDGRPEDIREMGYRLFNFGLEFDPDDCHRAVFRIGTIVVQPHHLGLPDDADPFAAIESVTLLPTLYHDESARPYVEVERPERDELGLPVYDRHYTGDPVVLETDVPFSFERGGYEFDGQTVTFPQYAFTLPLSR